MDGGRRARRILLQRLYEEEMNPHLATVDSRLSEEGVALGEEAIAFVVRLFDGVTERRLELDRKIDEYARRGGWAVERLSLIDRIILRAALYEIFYTESPNVKVVINEAVELAKTFSTDRSGRFVNGVLGRIVRSEPNPALSS